MNAEAFSSIPPRRPVALIDLVETKTPEANRDFVARVTQVAEAAGGRVMLANEAIAPMIVPDESARRSDHGIRLLVVTQYPTRQAGQIALAERKESGPEFSQFQSFLLPLEGRHAESSASEQIGPLAESLLLPDFRGF